MSPTHSLPSEKDVRMEDHQELLHQEVPSLFEFNANMSSDDEIDNYNA